MKFVKFVTKSKRSEQGKNQKLIKIINIWSQYAWQWYNGIHGILVISAKMV